MKKRRDKIIRNVVLTVTLLAAVLRSLFMIISKRIIAHLDRRKGGRTMNRDNYAVGVARDYPACDDTPEELISLVTKLSDEEEEEDRPSDYSAQRFRELISETYHQLGGKILNPIVVSDSERGIRIAWKNADREVRVTLPDSAEKQAYIFFKSGNHSELDDVSAEVLARRLQAI
jgi:hypothetical protein